MALSKLHFLVVKLGPGKEANTNLKSGKKDKVCRRLQSPRFFSAEDWGWWTKRLKEALGRREKEKKTLVDLAR